jgi:hypothetical protein
LPIEAGITGPGIGILQRSVHFVTAAEKGAKNIAGWIPLEGSLPARPESAPRTSY